MIEPGPLLELLAEARAGGRPALVLTARRLAELLGAAPDTAWWARQRGVLGDAGFVAEVDPQRGWVTLTPASAGAAPPPTDLRLVLDWRAPGDGAHGPGLVRTGRQLAAVDDVAAAPPGADVVTDARVWSAGLERFRPLTDPDLRALALLAARVAQENSGGSGI